MVIKAARPVVPSVSRIRWTSNGYVANNHPAPWADADIRGTHSRGLDEFQLETEYLSMMGSIRASRFDSLKYRPEQWWSGRPSSKREHEPLPRAVTGSCSTLQPDGTVTCRLPTNTTGQKKSWQPAPIRTGHHRRSRLPTRRSKRS